MEQVTLENYVKAIYHLSEGNKWMVTNKKIAEKLSVIPATVTEAVKKMAENGYVEYEKSYGSKLTSRGHKLALTVIRRHRLWETFLEKELDFKWDEVHDIAEELEHIANDKLINRLSEKLGNPLYDPHGDPIPNEKGKFNKNDFITMDRVKKLGKYRIEGVKNHSQAFLKYCEKNVLTIATVIEIASIEEFDGSLSVLTNQKAVLIGKTTASFLILSKA
jgi:DtxR family Mn-dependent transcriptional regulator